VLLAVSFWLVSTAPARAGACVGDCGGDGRVTIDEVVLGVGIAADPQLLSRCPAFEVVPDGSITVDELILGLRSAFVGCPLPQILVGAAAGRRTETVDLPIALATQGRAIVRITPATATATEGIVIIDFGLFFGEGPGGVITQNFTLSAADVTNIQLDLCPERSRRAQHERIKPLCRKHSAHPERVEGRAECVFRTPRAPGN
jgi:hypothetical protein